MGRTSAHSRDINTERKHELKTQWAAWAALGLLAVGSVAARADEGMWLYNDLPKQQLQKKYGFTLSDAWAQHLQRSSVRFDNGGSGSFVSADGLVMTNHHVALDTLQKLSTPGHNYAQTGFYARTRAEEPKAPDLELNVLDSITTVTDQVNAAVTPQMTPAQAFLARRAAIAAITKEAQDKTGLRSDVVTLFGGARYDLYQYKRYTDVRLVMAPEQNTAFFGGDPDNFEYPRYDLDMSFFRVYENGKPAQIKDYLTWSKAGAQDGDLVFVSGHPGHTSRLNTVSDLAYERDVALPFVLDVLRRKEVLLQSWGARLPENARVSREELFGIQNARKLLTGELQGLQDPAFFAQKQAQERALRARIAADPKLQASYGAAWGQIDQAIAAQKALFAKYGLLTGGRGIDSDLFDTALTLVQKAEEDQKPNGERLPEFNDSNRQSLELELFSPAPISLPFEQIRLADSLAQVEESLGANDPLVVQMLAGKSPQERASELIAGTKLADVAERRRLSDGGLTAIQAASDPMIQLARLLDPTLRDIRQQSDSSIASVRRQAYSRIAQAEVAAGTGNAYPDATFTLRLAYGTVSGYRQNGQAVPAMTKMGDLFAYAAAHDDQPPFQPSASWVKAQTKIAPDTPFDFVSTADIIGGNSGSPVVNRAGELVGLIFDGNIQSLVSDYGYTETQSRAVAVASPAMIEALRQVYGDSALADEIVSGHAR